MIGKEISMYDTEALKQKARYVRISSAGMKESSPHDVIEVGKRG